MLNKEMYDLSLPNVEPTFLPFKTLHTFGEHMHSLVHNSIKGLNAIHKVKTKQQKLGIDMNDGLLQLLNFSNEIKFSLKREKYKG